MAPAETIAGFDTNPRNYPWPKESSLMEEIRENIRLDEEYERQWRPQCLEDAYFALGEVDGCSTQWNQDDVEARRALGTPSITLNRVPQFINRVANQGIQQPMAIKVIPVEDSDVEDAEIRQGLIRSIESRSNADIARSTARRHMITSGIGYTRIVSDYCSDDSFDQELLIKRVLNPFSIYFDRGAQEPDYSDAQHCSIHGRISKQQHERDFPNAELNHFTDFTGLGDSWTEWLLGKDQFRICEYFRVAFRKRKLVAIANFMGGEMTVVGFADEFVQQIGRGGMDEHRELGLIVKERDVQIPQVEWYKVNGHEILQKRLWPGRWIPVVPWIGQEELLDGRRHISGIVRSAKPAVQLYNFWVSAMTELVGQLPKQSWIATAEQIKGYEAMYEQANRRNFPVMLYNAAMGPNGEILPMPQRTGGVDPRFTAISAALVQADQDMKATFGIYDAALGERGPQESGKAINARKLESGMAWMHMAEAEGRSIRFEGKILLDSIPRIYTGPRMERITMPDNSTQIIPLYQQGKWKGKERYFDLSVGKYDVIVASQPKYETQREESADKLTELMRVVPPDMAAVMAPEVVRSIDMPKSIEMAQRMEQVLPPNLRPPNEDDELQPAAQQALMAAEAKIAELEQALEQAATMIERDQVATESKERIAAADNQNELDIAMLVESNKAAIAEQNNEVKLAIAQISQDLGEMNGRLKAMEMDARANATQREQSQSE